MYMYCTMCYSGMSFFLVGTAYIPLWGRATHTHTHASLPYKVEQELDGLVGREAAERKGIDLYLRMEREEEAFFALFFAVHRSSFLRRWHIRYHDTFFFIL